MSLIQDTGTAICMGKRGMHVLTDGNDEEMLSRGVYDAYQEKNLRYSQVGHVLRTRAEGGICRREKSPMLRSFPCIGCTA
eukprot:scaffold1790_cov257-Pinguiococcus_pyrenoidosus.AAC.41